MYLTMFQEDKQYYFNKCKLSHELRKEGKFDQAYDAALESENESAIAWALYALLKDRFEKGKIDEAQKYSRALEKINFDEVYFGENVKKYYEKIKSAMNKETKFLQRYLQKCKQGKANEAYNEIKPFLKHNSFSEIYHPLLGEIILWALVEMIDKCSIDEVREMFTIYFDELKIPRPSTLHSSMLRAFLMFHKKYTKDFDICEFIEKWDISNIRQDDYLPKESKHGGKLQPAAEFLFSEIINSKVCKRKIMSYFNLLPEYRNDEKDVVRNLLKSKFPRSFKDI